MVIIDRRGRIRVFNPAAENLFGYTEAEVIGQNVALLMPTSEASRHDGFMRSYQETGRRRIIGIGREVKGRRKDGSEFPLSLAISEIAFGGGDRGVDPAEALAYVGILRDLSEQKKTYAALTDARMRAEIASNAKTEFLSRMSHELRTPLNAILGFAQLLEMSPESVTPERRRDYVQSILGPARHLAALIDDVLDIARIEAGRLHVAVRTIDLAQIALEAAGMVKGMAERRGIQLRIDPAIAAPGPLVLADPVRLTQCLVNLLSNGIKYNRPAGEVSLAITETGPAGPVRLTVADTGIGIPEERLGELFMPFQRLHPAREEIEGAGIGLALTRQLIDAMRGSIAVESRVDVGSRFHVELRAGGSVRIDPPQPRRLHHAPRPRVRRQLEGRKIALYVEDNPANVDLMRSLFSSLPATELKIAYTGETGLAIADSEPVGLVILDVNLPGIDGFETIRRLKSSRRTADLPVIGLSARATEQDISRATELGFYRYFVKPMNVPEFMESVRAVL
jgi:PAS domain S-box-containing protein